MKKLKMYCGYNPNDRKYYCSTKTEYGIVYPEQCEIILDHESLFNYIKENLNNYYFVLPCLVALDFEKRLKGREDEEN